MKSKTPIIITSAVAACIVCIVAVLAVKMSNANSPAINAEPDTYTDYQNQTDFSQPVYNDFTFDEIETTYPKKLYMLFSVVNSSLRLSASIGCS